MFHLNMSKVTARATANRFMSLTLKIFKILQLLVTVVKNFPELCSFSVIGSVTQLGCYLSLTS